MDDSSSTIRSPAQAQWIAVVAVFGATWGAAEISLGAVLRSAAVPLHGTLMTGIGVVIMLATRGLLTAQGQSGRGVGLAVGAVAATMLPLSISRGIVPAMVGILAEAAALELVLFAGRPGRWRCGVAGALTALVPPVQKLLWLTAQYGPAAMSTFREILLEKQGGARLGMAGFAAGSLLALVLVVSAVYGAVCGVIGWSLIRQILKRLGRGPA